MSGDRVHQLAQAVQVADLLADRVDQLIETFGQDRHGDDTWGERCVIAMGNVVRARHAYSTVRDPDAVRR
jgi:hypothetical protein